MHITKIKNSVAGCLLVMTSFLLITVSVMGAEQEFKTLELVHTYQSEKEFQVANARLLREKHLIVDDGEMITFFDPETGRILKQIQKEQTFDRVMSSLTTTERQQLEDQITPKALMKTFREYVIPSYGSEPYLQIREYETAISDHTEGDGYQKLLRSTIYNRQGEFMMDLPLDISAVVLAPDRKHLIGYSTSLIHPGEYLYFYSKPGELAKKVPFPHGGGTEINYSADSEYLAIWSIWGYEFFIFTKTGELVLKEDAKKYITPQNINLYEAFVSNNAEYILLCMGKDEILLNENGTQLWKLPHKTGFRVASAYFNISHGQLYISTGFPGIRSNTPGWLRIVNLTDGIVLDEIMPIYSYTIINQTLYINRGGRYEEYHIK